MLHQVRRKYVICAPERGNYVPRASEHECAGNIGNAFFTLESSHCGITSGQNNNISICVQLHDFERLQNAVFSRRGVAKQQESCAIRVFFVGDSMHRQVNNLKFVQTSVFECRLCRI